MISSELCAGDELAAAFNLPSAFFFLIFLKRVKRLADVSKMQVDFIGRKMRFAKRLNKVSLNSLLIIFDLIKFIAVKVRFGAF